MYIYVGMSKEEKKYIYIAKHYLRMLRGYWMVIQQILRASTDSKSMDDQNDASRVYIRIIFNLCYLNQVIRIYFNENLITRQILV